MITTVKTLNLEEVATLLGKKASTVYRDLKRNPEGVPTRLNIPGSNKVVFLESDVLEFLENCRVKKSKGGRPRKSVS